MIELQQLHDSVLNGDAKAAKSITEQALAAGHEPLQLVQQYMMPAMDGVGRLVQSHARAVSASSLSEDVPRLAAGVDGGHVTVAAAADLLSRRAFKRRAVHRPVRQHNAICSSNRTRNPRVWHR